MKFTVAAICVLLAIAGKAQGAAHGDKPATVVDLAVSQDPEFTTLVAAVTAADLGEPLSGDGPFTVFAPTNAAFEALLTEMEMNATALLASEDLAGILTYHVIAGNKVMSLDLSDGMTATTVNGANVTIKVTDGTVMVNDATVTAADFEAGNGVVHIIDKVLIPPTPEDPADDDESASSMTEDPADDDESASSMTEDPADDDESASSMTEDPADDDESASSMTVFSALAGVASLMLSLVM